MLTVRETDRKVLFIQNNSEFQDLIKSMIEDKENMKSGVNGILEFKNFKKILKDKK